MDVKCDLMGVYYGNLTRNITRSSRYYYLCKALEMSVMRILVLSVLFFGVLALSSCSGEADYSVTETEEVGSAKTVASLYVEGMMCEAACGGKIQKELSQLACVLSASIEFDENKNLDIAIVEFDNSCCSLEDMVNTVHAISDGAYQVKKVEVVTYSPAAGKYSTEETAYDFNNTFSMSSLFKSVTLILELR